VDEPAAFERQLLGLRQRLALDLRGELLELGYALVEHLQAVREPGEAPLETRAAEESQEAVHRADGLTEPLALFRYGFALLGETLALLLDGAEAPLSLGELRLVQLRTLAPLALQLELLRELLEPLDADSPQMAQLEIHHRIGGGERIGQQPLEALEL